MDTKCNATLWQQRITTRWTAADRRLGAPDTAAIHEARTRLVESLTSGGNRFYHNGPHTANVLDIATALASTSQSGDVSENAIVYAAIFHDADPVSEEKSARMATEYLGLIGAPAEVQVEAERLILLTKHSALCDQGDRSGQAICDADLAILGASPEEYAQYSAAIRAEYSHVPLDVFSEKRLEILQRFLRRQIYQTAEMSAFERQARTNLLTECAELSRNSA